jgi:hypothetical protein
MDGRRGQSRHSKRWYEYVKSKQAWFNLLHHEEKIRCPDELVIIMKSSVFWDITTCAKLKFSRRLGGTCSLHLQEQRMSQSRNQCEAGSRQSLWTPHILHTSSFLAWGDYSSIGTTIREALLATCFTLVPYLASSSTLKMEVTCSSETSVDFHRTTRLYTPGDTTLHNHRCENLKSYVEIII